MKKSKSIIHSFKYATEGFLSAFKTERNMKMHIHAYVGKRKHKSMSERSGERCYY